MADLLTQIQRDIETRLKELRPLVEEAQRLEQALAAFGEDGSRRPARQRPSPARQRPSRPAARKSQPRRRARATRAETESRRRQLLSLLTGDPSTRPSALALMLDMSRPAVYQMLNRLEAEGAVKKTDRGWEVQREATAAGQATDGSQ